MSESSLSPTGELSAAESSNPSSESRYTLGRLIGLLDGIERNREFHRLHQQEQLRRDPVRGALNATYSAVLRWQPNERETPGIRRIELLCDLEPGEAGINAAKVRRLRARICRQQHWQPPHADQLTLDEAADLLEGIQRVTVDELKQISQDQLHHGLATLDTIGVGPNEEIQVTGLSCKVIAGTTPTACPNANPVLPRSMLPLAERAIRRLYQLPECTTVHWVGHDSGMRNHCRCHPNAPFAAPFDQHRWAAVVQETKQPAQESEGESSGRDRTADDGSLRDHLGREQSGPTATAVNNLDKTHDTGATRRPGRPPDSTKQAVVKYVRELREEKMLWKNIPNAVLEKFGVKYTAETLRGYLKSG